MRASRSALFAAILPVLMLAAPRPAPSQDALTVPRLSGTALIDTMMGRVWEEGKITPAGPASDADFLRRAALDLTGTIPTSEDVRLFLADTSADKRSRAIDTLLENERFGRHWADVWLNVFRNDENVGRLRTMRGAFREWLAGQFNDNTPWDEIVTDMLTVTGTSDENPQVYYLLQNYYVNRREYALEIAGPATGHFLGIQMACARCHDHKYIDDMKQQRFYEMAAFFQKIRPITINQKEIRAARREYQKALREKKGNARELRRKFRRIEQIVRFDDRARVRELRMPPQEGRKTGRKVEPVFYEMGGEGIVSAAMNRREAFAGILTGDNIQFARSAVNRTWGFMMGRGFVTPGDGFAEFPVAHTKVLDAIARDLMDHDYDLKFLVRSIANSQVYQLSSRTGERKRVEPTDFAVAPLRPMSPQQLTGALSEILGRNDARSRRRGRGMGMVVGRSNAFDLDLDNVPAYKISIQQALILMNSGTVSSLAQQVATRLWRRHRDDPDAAVEELFLKILSRRPTDEERESFVAHVENDRRGERLQDVAWALLNSSEFILIR